MDLSVHIIESEFDRSRAIKALKSAPLRDSNGEPLVLQYGHAETGRTLAQNALLWSWHRLVAFQTGNTARQIHEFIRAMFLSPRVVEAGGTIKEVLPSTTELTRKEMKILMDQYQAWAASDLGIDLPDGKDAERWAMIKNASGEALRELIQLKAVA